MQIRRFTPKQALQWITAGVRFAKKRPVFWLVFSLIYGISLIVLSLIPILGSFVALFFVPLVYASALYAVRDHLNPNAPAPKQHADEAAAAAKAGIRALLSDKAVEMIVVGLLAMVAGVAISIVYGIVGGGAVKNTSGFFTLALDNMLFVIAATAAVHALSLVLIMLLIYAIPLYVLVGVDPVNSLKLSLQASLKNLIPFIVWIGVLYAPFAVIQFAGPYLAGFDLILLLLCAIIILPIFVNSAFASTKVMYQK